MWSRGLLGVLNRTPWETSYCSQLLRLPSSVKVSMEQDLLRLFCLHIQYTSISSMQTFYKKRTWPKSLTLEPKDLGLLFKGMLLDKILNQSDLPPDLTMYSLNIHLKFVLPSLPLFSSKWLFLRVCHTKILHGISAFPALLLCIFLHISSLTNTIGHNTYIILPWALSDIFLGE